MIQAMIMRSVHLCLSVSLLALAFGAPVGVAFAQSGPQSESNALSRQLENEAQPSRQGRVQSEEQKDLQPSAGVNVYQRMGAELPALPPEKEFKGRVDE
ncbi:MAG: enhanced entry protein, partial [Agrobacterium fabrum]